VYLQDDIKCVFYKYNLKFQLPQGGEKMRSQETLPTLYIKREREGGENKIVRMPACSTSVVFGTVHVVGQSAVTAGRTVAVW
jgi:hypothetical protein